MISRRIAWILALCAALGGAGLISTPTVSLGQTQAEAFVPIEEGMSGPRVTELQVLLTELGYYKGEVNGLFDGPTVEAVAVFQASQQLPQSRVLDAATWDRLQFTQSGSLGANATATPTASPSTKPTAKPTPKPTAAVTVAKAPDSRLRWLLLGSAGLGIGAGCYGLVRTTRKPIKPKSKRLKARSLTPSTTQAIATSPTEVLTPGLRERGAATAVQAPEASDDGGTPPNEPDYSESDYSVTRSATRLPRIDIVEALMVDLQSVDAEKRRKAIWELGQRGDSRAVQPLVNLMAISDSRQRSLILASLSEIGIQTLKPMKRALAMSLQDENADVRKNAIRDLTRIYDLVGQISQLLNFATEDSDGEVRETAQWALGQLSRIRSTTVDQTPLLQQSISPPELFGEDVKLQERNPDYGA